MKKSTVKEKYLRIKGFSVNSNGLLIETKYQVVENKDEIIDLTNIYDLERYLEGLENEDAFIRRREEVFSEFRKLEKSFNEAKKLFEAASANFRYAIDNNVHDKDAYFEYNLRLRNYMNVIDEIIGEK